MDTYIEIIKKIPGIVVKDYSFNKEGQNNDVVIINDEYVFKFPKYSKGIESLKKETDLLVVLNKYVTLSIPQPEYCKFDSLTAGQAYCGYKLIKGISFSRKKFDDVKDKETIANQLALFLKQLHGIPLSEVKGLTLEAADNHSEWRNLFRKIQDKLFPYMKKETKDSISDSFNNFFEQSFSINQTIIHGDFGPSNIIFDINSQKISGIIDFSEVTIGDPASDIASLIGPLGYGEDFIKYFEPVYHNVDELMQRARFYASTFALQEALFGIEFGDREAFNAGMKQYL